MKKKKEIEARMKACMNAHRHWLWYDQVHYLTEYGVEYPKKIQDLPDMFEFCPDGKRLPEYNEEQRPYEVAMELAWVLGIEDKIFKKMAKYQEEVEKFLISPKVKKVEAEMKEDLGDWEYSIK